MGGVHLFYFLVLDVVQPNIYAYIASFDARSINILLDTLFQLARLVYYREGHNLFSYHNHGSL